LHSAKFLGESDEKPFRSADVAEPIRVLILDNFAYGLRSAVEKPSRRLVDVVHGEHDSEVAWRVYRSGAVICDGSRCEEAGELETTVAIRRTHRSNLDALTGQAGDTSRPFSFDRGPPSSSRPSSRRKSIVLSRSSTTIPTLSIRLSAMCGIYKMSSGSNNGPLLQRRSTNGAEPVRLLPYSPYSKRITGNPEVTVRLVTGNAPLFTNPRSL
jgi:hypothetical protein